MATKYPAPSPPFIQARHRGGSQVPKAIVIHGTVSSDNAGTAKNIAQWWAGRTSPVTSCHYVVDPKSTYQCVGDHTIAFHCGSNTGCIGIELCDEQTGPASRWQDADSQAIIRRAARLTAELCLAYGIEAKRPTVAELKRKGKHGIYGHNDSRLAFGGTSHTDPRDFPWAQFLHLVRAEIAKIKNATVTPPKPPTAPVRRKRFKVLHAPLHGVSSTDREVQRALDRPGVVGVSFTESDRRYRFLMSRPRWRIVTGRGFRDRRGRIVDRDITLAVRRYRKHVTHGTIKASEASTPIKIAPPRFISYSVDYVNGQMLAMIGFHPNAAVRNAWSTDRAEKYRESMEELEQLVIRLRRAYGKDLDIVILTDANYPDVKDDRYWSPRNTFIRLGLSWYDRGIDWVAHSKGLKRVSVRVIPKGDNLAAGQNGQDHPWIEVEFEQV